MPSDFKKIIAARFLFTFATEMQGIILGWRMYVLTHNPLYLGLIGLAEAVPAIGLALYAGYIVDRSRPLRILYLVLIFSFLSALILLLSQIPGENLSIHLQVVALFVSSFLTGMARAFSQPSIFAIVPRIIERKDLPRSSAWMAMSMQIARITGPALGGLLFGLIGISTSASVVCASLLLSIGALSFFKTPLGALEHSPRGKSVYKEFFSGATFVFKHPILLPALSLDMVSVLFGGVTALLPIYAAEILKVGPQGLGTLRAAPAIGAAIMSLWLTKRDIRQRAGAWLFSAVTGFGVCILVFSLSHSFALSLFALAFSGAFDSISMVIRTAAVQLSSPDSMRGKISAVNSIFIGSSNEIGEFESGVAARLIGTVPAAVVGGVICLLTALVLSLIAPRLRQLDLNELKGV